MWTQTKMAPLLITTGCMLSFSCIHFWPINPHQEEMSSKVKSSSLLDLNIRLLSLCRSESGFGSYADFQGWLQTTGCWASTSAKVYMNRNNWNRRLSRFHHFLLKVQFPGNAFLLVTGGNPMIPAWPWTKEHDSLIPLMPPSVRGDGGYHLAPSCTPWSHAHLDTTIEFTWAFQLVSLLDSSSPAKWHSKEYYPIL